MPSLPRLRLKPGREKSLKRFHPWVFSGAIAGLEEEIELTPGALVDVVSASGEWLARGYANPDSQIAVRLLTFDESEAIDDAWLARRIAASVARRADFATPDGACRLIHAESDGLPGLIVDRYADVLVMQLLTAGMERWRPVIVDALASHGAPRAIVERSDADVRELEGLPPNVGVPFGDLVEPVVITEHGVRYHVDVLRGQKTGFYLDQRDNRARVAALAQGARVLNGYCYTGGFTLGAFAHGAAHVTSIDSSADALARLDGHLALNQLDASRSRAIAGDVPTVLRALRNDRAQFDLIVLDPPKFAPTEKHVEKAARAYKDINLLAFKLLAPGGHLATFSCSGGVSGELFQKIVAGAAVDARVDALIVARLAASADHPVSIHFPEGEYLKGLLLRKS